MLKRILVFLLLSLPAYAEPQHLTILHFNDFHGHIEQAARIAAKINQIKAENKEKGYITLVFNGGDLISGTPVSAKFGGKAEVDFLNAINIDSFVIGNHDFDFNSAGIAQFKPLFPVMAANIYIKDSHALFATPSVILSSDEKLKIGVIGLTHPETPSLATPKNIIQLRFDKPIPIAKKLMRDLLKNTDIQIALTHEGVLNDIALAKAVKGLDAVVGGHDHVKANEYCRTVKQIPVCQTPSYGSFLGRIDLEIDGKKVKETSHELIAIDDKTREDRKIALLMKPYLDSTGTEMKKIIGVAAENINHERSSSTTPLGSLITTAMKDYLKADFGVTNTGGIRRPIKKGNITKGDIEEVLPFPNTVLKIAMTGKEIDLLFKEAKKLGKTLQLAGIKPEDKLDPKKEYTIATIDYLTNGGDGYTVFKKARVVENSGKYIKEIFTDYIRRMKKL
jgi:5'-nucleotidase